MATRTTVPTEPSELAGFAAAQSPDVLVVVDPEGNLRFASASATRVLGVDPDTKTGLPIWDFVHPDDLVTAAGALNEATRSSGYHQPAVFRVRHDDGRWVECEVNGVMVEEADGAWLVLAIRTTGDRDEVMGRRRRIEQLIRLASLECSAVPWVEADALAERYLQDLAGIVGAELAELAWEELDDEMVVGAHWPVVRLGVSAPVTRMSFESLWPMHETASQLLSFSTDLAALAPSPMRDRLLALRSEAVVEVPLSARPPRAVLRLAFGPNWRRWDDANVDLVVVLASTIMATLRRCRAEADLYEQARTDPLTGLMNRAELYQRFEDMLEVHEARRGGGLPTSLGVLYCDLDHFKTVNDLYGHTAGDRLLVSVSEALRANTREVDLIARVGGDEFVLVCPDLDSPESLSTMVARLSHAVAELAPEGVPLRLSVGAAVAEPDLSPDDLIRLADEAMYRAKREARRPGPGGVQGRWAMASSKTR